MVRSALLFECFVSKETAETATGFRQLLTKTHPMHFLNSFQRLSAPASGNLSVDSYFHLLCYEEGDIKSPNITMKLPKQTEKGQTHLGVGPPARALISKMQTTKMRLCLVAMLLLLGSSQWDAWAGGAFICEVARGQGQSLCREFLSIPAGEELKFNYGKRCFVTLGCPGFSYG